MQNFTGTENLQIDIANQFGKDKETWSDRLAWFKSNEHQLDQLTTSADEPLLYKKALNALACAHIGEASGHLMALDGTASGIQIMACLSGCNTTAKQVNLINTGNREDVYGNVANIMNVKLAGQQVITRSEVKKPVMVTTYNSKKEPRNLLGEGPALEAFYLTLEDLIPGALAVMDTLNQCWSSSVKVMQWTLPDGHVSVCPVTEMINARIEVAELGGASFTHRTKVVRPSKKGTSLPANVIQSIDAYVCREMVRRCTADGFDLLTIHDSFHAHPNNMNNVRYHYKEILGEICDLNLLESICYELTGLKRSIKKFSLGMGNLVRGSEYALS